MNFCAKDNMLRPSNYLVFWKQNIFWNAENVFVEVLAESCQHFLRRLCVLNKDNNDQVRVDLLTRGIGMLAPQVLLSKSLREYRHFSTIEKV